MVEIFQLQLHKSSAVPLYQQLAEGIEEIGRASCRERV